MPEKNRGSPTDALVLFAGLAKFEPAGRFDKRQQCRPADLLLSYHLQAKRLQWVPLTAVHHAGEHVYTMCHLISGLKLPGWTSLVCKAAKLLSQFVVALLQLAAVELQAMAT